MCPLATIKNLETRCTIPALKTALGRLHLAGVLTQHIAFRESENKSGFFSERADKLTMLTEGVKLLREAGCLLTQEVSSDLGHVTLSLAPLPNIQTAGVLARHTGETRTLLNQYQAVGGSVVLPDSVDHALSTEAIERLGLTVTDVVSVPYKNG
ncbi:MAG: hypothetical protein A3J38_09545 [Gammaproteobacteria bacterium RIFCSPHIGHO2_12_FULL_45_9]|nr:MAG: hypothetical protein A3J38_09545 [Gammaproteobacteria bacterium RIFCSPHIGHO2_12_FULL_45_9]